MLLAVAPRACESEVLLARPRRNCTSCERDRLISSTFCCSCSERCRSAQFSCASQRRQPQREIAWLSQSGCARAVGVSRVGARVGARRRLEKRHGHCLLDLGTRVERLGHLLVEGRVGRVEHRLQLAHTPSELLVPLLELLRSGEGAVPNH
jgi:hypothetical protein